MSSSIAIVSESPLCGLPLCGAEVSQFITMLSTATLGQVAEIRAILERREEEVVSVKAEAKAPGAPKKAPKEKAPKPEKPAPMALPEAGSAAPAASEYRVSEIDETLCLGRNLKGGEDKRWKPIIYRESQCGGKVVEGSDLCAKCCKRQEKHAADPSVTKTDWNGRINEEPEAWVRMLGTAWATEKKPKFLGAASASASVADAEGAASENASVQEEMPAAAAAPKAVKADKAAAKAAKEAEKAAAKAAKEAEKEAAKAAKAATAAAEKEAAKAAKAKPKAEAKSKPKAKSEAKKAAVAEVKEATAELVLIDGSMYMVKKGNVYEYNELEEVAGDFCGRLNADSTIDTDADEVTAAESDTD